MVKRIIIAVSVCIIVIAILAFPRVVITFNYQYVTLNNPFNDQPFDRKVWITNTGNIKLDNPRADMVPDLIIHHLRKGMTQEEVLRLLGEPDLGKSKNLYRYNIGWGHTYQIDPYYLDLRFNMDGHLIIVEMLQG